MRSKLFFTPVIIFLMITSLMAQSEPVGDAKEAKDLKEAGDVFKYREIVVKDKKEQSGVVTLLTDEELKRSNKYDLVGLINETVPSFHTGFNRIMGYGIANSNPGKMSLRGMGISSWGPTTGFPMLVDGIDTGAPIFSHAMPGALNIKNIERVEVYHSPQPVLFGDTAMAGAVNVITRRRKTEGTETKISGSYGSYNTTDDYVQHSGKFGIMDYGVSYNFQKSDGHRKEDVGGTEVTSAFQGQSGSGRFGFELGKHFYAGVSGYGYKEKTNDPGPDDRSVAVSGLEVFDITRGGGSVSLHNSFKIMEGFAQVYGNQGKHVITRPDTNAITFRSTDKIHGGKLQETLKPFDGSRITGGAEYKRYGGEIDGGSKLMDEEFVTEKSGYGLAEQKIFKVLILSGGARYTSNSEYGGYTAYQGGIIVNPHESTKLHANAAKGFTFPGLRYRFNPVGPSIDINADLKPETSLVYEAGIEQTFIETLVFDVTGYKIYSQDKIVISKGKWTNSESDINYKGAEATVKYSYKKTAGLNAGYSFIDTAYYNLGQKYVLNYVPKHKALAGVWVYLHHVYAGLNGEYVRDIWHDYTNEKKLDDFLVLNAKLAYDFLDHFQAFLNLNNITDKKYITYRRGDTAAGGYSMPGFNVLGGLTVTF